MTKMPELNVVSTGIKQGGVHATILPRRLG